MAQIENGGGNGKGKSHQKKMTIRVDFTPMVDMNMLLITFFMLCTTMIKTQTINIALPSNKEDLKEEQKSQAKADNAVTIILDAQRNANGEVDTVNGAIVPEVYYYEGKPNEIKGQVILDESNPDNILVKLPQGEEKIVKASFSATDANGIRKFIQLRNKDLLAKINAKREELKGKAKNGEIDMKEFNEAARQIRLDANDDTKPGYIENKPTIIIKATDAASYGSLVALLDEMQINQVVTYQIDNINATDMALLKDYRSRH